MGDWYAKQTIGLLPERAARQWGPREALAFQGRRWTFAEMHARVDAVARGLLSLGIAPGGQGRALDGQPSRVDRRDAVNPTWASNARRPTQYVPATRASPARSEGRAAVHWVTAPVGDAARAISHAWSGPPAIRSSAHRAGSGRTTRRTSRGSRGSFGGWPDPTGARR
jgi:hypothetical protein